MTTPTLTGIDIIDHEHSCLMELEARLSCFCAAADPVCHACEEEKRNDCDSTLSQHFGELLEYMIEHFRHEEQLMGCLTTEAARAHKREHATISELFVKLAKSKMGAEMLATPHELREIVRIWLLDHCANWDMPLAAQLRAQPPLPEAS
jgi:hemerythrin-like metal-binding protein